MLATAATVAMTGRRGAATAIRSASGLGVFFDSDFVWLNFISYDSILFDIIRY